MMSRVLLLVLLLVLCVTQSSAWRVGGGDRLRQTFQATSSFALPSNASSTVGFSWTVIEQNVFGAVRAAPATQWRNDSATLDVWFTTSSTMNDANGYVFRFGVAANGTIGKCVVAVLPAANSSSVRGLGTPALCGASVVVGVQDRVIAYDASDCNVVRWEFGLPQDDPATPLLDGDADSLRPPAASCSADDTVVYVQTRHSLVAISNSNGTLLWRTRIAPSGVDLVASPASGQSPSLCNATLYATSLDSSTGASWLYAVDAGGIVRWSRAIDAARSNLSSACVVSSAAVDAHCRIAVVATSFGVYAFDLDASGASLALPGAATLGLCGAQSLLLLENDSGNSTTMTLVTTADQSLAPNATSTACSSDDGSMAVEIDLIASSSRLIWSRSGAEFSAFDVIASDDGQIIWCEGATLYVSSVDDSNASPAESFNGCYVNVIDRFNGSDVIVGLAANLQTPQLRVYSTFDASASTSSQTTALTTAPQTLPTTTPTTLTTPTFTVTAANQTVECEKFIDICEIVFCSSALTNSCLQLKCALFCNSMSPVDCSSLLPNFCVPSSVVDQPCDANCTLNYAWLFENSTTTSTTTVMTATAPNVTLTTDTNSDSSMLSTTTTTTATTMFSTTTSESNNTLSRSFTPAKSLQSPTSVWLYIGISGGALILFAIVVIVCCLLRSQRDKTRYMLMELEKGDDEPMI